MSILSKRFAEAKKNVLGIIRPGIKVLTQKHLTNPELVKMYKNVQSGLITAKDMEKEVFKKMNLEHVLKPINTDWFNLHPHDFVGGKATTDLILDMYGEKREGDTQKKLYTFPIVFSDTNLEQILDAKFQSFVGDVRFISKMSSDGTLVECHSMIGLTPQELAENKAKKYIKGVPIKSFVEGPCIPTSCHRYRTRSCQLRGKLNFHIPGVPGNGVIQIPTGSDYSMQQIWNALHEHYDLIGAIPSYDQNGNTIFTMTKKIQTMFVTNQQTGQTIETTQAVPWLMSTMDLSAVIKAKQLKAQKALEKPKTPDLSDLAPASWVNDPSVPSASTASVVDDVSIVEDVKISAKSELTELELSLKELENLAANFSNELSEYATIKYGGNWYEDVKVIKILVSFVQRQHLGDDEMKLLLYCLHAVEFHKLPIQIWQYFKDIYPNKDLDSLTNMQYCLDEIIALNEPQAMVNKVHELINNKAFDKDVPV